MAESRREFLRQIAGVVAAPIALELGGASRALAAAPALHYRDMAPGVVLDAQTPHVIRPFWYYDPDNRSRLWSAIEKLAQANEALTGDPTSMERAGRIKKDFRTSTTAASGICNGVANNRYFFQLPPLPVELAGQSFTVDDIDGVGGLHDYGMAWADELFNGRKVMFGERGSVRLMHEMAVKHVGKEGMPIIGDHRSQVVGEVWSTAYKKWLIQQVGRNGDSTIFLATATGDGYKEMGEDSVTRSVTYEFNPDDPEDLGRYLGGQRFSKWWRPNPDEALFWEDYRTIGEQYLFNSTMNETYYKLQEAAATPYLS